MAGFGSMASEVYYDPMTGLPITQPDVAPADVVAVPNTQGTLSKIAHRLTGTQFGEPRMQLWPEKLVRSAVTLPGDIASGAEPMMPPGIRREDFTDIPPQQAHGAGVEPGIFGNTMFTPMRAEPNDPAYMRAQDTAGIAGGGMMFGSLARPAAETGLRVLGRQIMSDTATPGAPLAALEAGKALAVERRNRGWNTGKRAEGHDFKRPDPPEEFDRLHATARGYYEAQKPSPDSPLLTPEDRAFIGAGKFLEDSSVTGAPIAALEKVSAPSIVKTKLFDADGNPIAGPAYQKEARAVLDDIAAGPKGAGPLDLSTQAMVPDVPQAPLERYVPARGISPRLVEALQNPEVRAGLAESMEAGRGVANWYHTEPVRRAFIDELGPAKGQAEFKRYMDTVAATSPRSDVPTNIRNASYYYQQGTPESLPAKNPYPYGHVAQNLHRGNFGSISGKGWDPLQNPKPASFAENLRGNLEPVTVDTHAFRNIAMRTGDPRFLETSFTQKFKGEPGPDSLVRRFGEMKGDTVTFRPQQLLKEGRITMEEAQKQPSFWAAKPKDNEYAAAEALFRETGNDLGLRPADAQAAAWAGGGEMTGLGTVGTHTFPELFNERVLFTARMRGESPQKTLSDFVRGKAALLEDSSVTGAPLAALQKYKKDMVEKYGPESTRTKMTRDELDHYEKLRGNMSRAIENPDAPPLDRAIDTPQFKDWFGNSKIVDDEGAPKRLYHATTKDFTEFKPGGFDPELSGHAIWLSPYDDLQAAAHNVGGHRGQFKEGARVLPVYAKIERPLMLDDRATLDWARQVYDQPSMPQLLSEEAVKKLKADGYDGIVYKDPYGAPGQKGDEIIAFSGDQLKSATGNRGTFDRSGNLLLEDSAVTGAPLAALEKAGKMEAIGRKTREGTYYEVLKNPTKSDLLSLGKDYPTMGRGAPQMRVMKVGDDTYAWPATYATHDQIAKSLGLNHPGFDNLDNVAVTPRGLAGGKKDWNSLFEDSATTGAPLSALEKGPAGAYHGLLDQPAGGAYKASHGPETQPATREASPSAGPAPGRDVAGGAGGGDAGVAEAQAAAARRAGAYKPLADLPTKAMKIGDEYFAPGPIASVKDVAAKYMENRPKSSFFKEPDRYHPLDPEHSTAIAKAFDEMKHAPNDPAVRNSYKAMIDETLAQYQAIKESGLKIEAIPEGMPDPYAKNPRLAAKDVADNNHLWFFPTDQGFGSGGKIDLKKHPMMQKTGEKLGDRELLANDIFRVVHDYFGHLKEGHGFRAAGEDNAWRSHASMYSDLARPAMTTETRGQNSWVNYGPHGEKNRTASGVDTVYADQKVGLLPEWTMRDRGSPEPIITYHGSPHGFDRFDMSKIGTGEGAQAYGYGLYTAENPKVAKMYRDQLSANQSFEKDGKPVMWTDVADDLVAGIKTAGAYHPDQTGQIVHQITSMMERGKSVATIRKNYDPPAGFEKGWNAALDRAQAYKFNKRPGHTYEAAIDAPKEKFLDWEKPLKDQPKEVQDLFSKEFGVPMTARRPAGELYDNAARARGQKWVSEALKEAGVPGIKYPDQGSRGLGIKAGKTHNYVTFTEPRILRRYAIPGVIGGGLTFGSMARDEK